MAVNLKGRSFLTLLDFTQIEIYYLLDLARQLKEAKYAGTEQKPLAGKSVALLDFLRYLVLLLKYSYKI